jgi:hypothetical protein
MDKRKEKKQKEIGKKDKLKRTKVNETWCVFLM